MKDLYCAECGKELYIIQKAVPSLGKVFNLTQPHNCLPIDRCEFYPLPGTGEGVCLAGSEVSDDKHLLLGVCTIEKGRFCEWAMDKRKAKKFNPVEKKDKTSSKLDKLFDSFKFVKKLNGLRPVGVETGRITGDKRDKEHLRKELLTSTAPAGLRDLIKFIPNSQPENDISVEPEED